MRNFQILVLALTAAVMPAQPVVPPPNAAQIDEMKKLAAMPTPKTADGHPDLNGFWGFNPMAAAAAVLGTEKVSLDGKVAVAGHESLEQQFNISGVARRKADTAARPVYKAQFRQRAAENFERAAFLDPAYKCMPAGVPRVGAPSEIVQTPKAIYFLYEARNVYRVIPTDGKAHDTNAERMPMGDSIGKWEGDTLVVDVVNLDENTWLDGDGSFHTKDMHVVERFTRRGNTLEYTYTVEDPAVMEKPFASRPRTFTLGAASKHAAEDYACLETDQEHLTTNERH